MRANQALKISGIVLAGILMLPQTGWAGNSVTRWMEQAMQTVRARNIGTPAAGRVYAMVAVSIYDAVNGIDVVRHHGGEHALVRPDGAPVRGQRDAAVAAAAHAVLTGLAPLQAPVLNAALAADLAALGATDRAVVAGRNWGAYVGQQVLSARQNDGTQVALNMPAGSAVGEHRALFDARFANMATFGIADPTAFTSAGPPALTGTDYAAAFNDVKLYGRADGDPERDAIALFWLAENNTVRETGTWMQALVAIVNQQGTDGNLSDTARLFALVAMAIADSVKVVWATKADFFSWRPFVAIREADLDGNTDTDQDAFWTPRNTSIGGSPEYNSGTSAFAGAASAVLENFYCEAALPFCFQTDAPTAPRCYSSALEAAEEAGRSRIYQGIHFQFSNEDGRALGRAIGDEIVSSRLRPIGPAGLLKGCK